MFARFSFSLTWNCSEEHYLNIVFKKNKFDVTNISSTERKLTSTAAFQCPVRMKIF